MATSPDGKTVYVAGTGDESKTLFGGTQHFVDYVTIAYNASTGRKVWVARYPIRGRNFAEIGGIVVSPDGSRVYVTGDNGGPKAATVAYKASNGARVWAARYKGSAGATASSHLLAVSSDGKRVYVTNSGGRHLVLLAYNAKNGTKAWTAQYQAPKKETAVPTALALSPDGTSVYVAALWQTPNSVSYLTLAYNTATGASNWNTLYQGASPTGIAVSPDGSRVFVTGSSGYIDSTIAYDAATGSQVWLATYQSPYGQTIAEALAVSPDGSRVYVSGSGEDLVTIAYNADSGDQAWLTRYIRPAKRKDDYVSALAVSPDGTKVFVAGTTRNPNYTRSSGLTLAYNAATGGQLWLDRYTAPKNRRASFSAMAVSPNNSRIYVTGVAQVSRSICSPPGITPPIWACGKAELTIAYKTG